MFSQLVMMTIPPDFVPVFSNTTATSYIQEFVLKGQTVEKWSQMVTLTGARDAAVNGQVSPAMFVQRIAAGFKRACPDSYTEKPLGSLQINGHDAFVALAGCGAVQSGMPRSEIALLVAVKGSSDIYTLQWAERGTPVEQAPVLDEAAWKARFQALGPVRVCDRIPGEVAPYVSCIGQQPQK